MKHIKKTLTNGQGFDNECWIADNGQFDLAKDMASVVLRGWKDKDAKNANLQPSDVRAAGFSPSAIEAYQTLFGELLAKLIGTSGALEGGTIDEEGSITCSRTSESGHTVTYWRSATGSFSLASDSGVVSLRGWKDQSAYAAGGNSAMAVNMQVTLSELTTFEAAWAAIAAYLITSETSAFSGGTIEDL